MNNKFLSFKKPIKVGDEIYIIVKELPPIILSSDKKVEKYKCDKQCYLWEPRKVVIDFIDETSGKAYDENSGLIDDDIVKFDNYDNALDYCKVKNETEKNNVKN